jgi:transposase
MTGTKRTWSVHLRRRPPCEVGWGLEPVSMDSDRRSTQVERLQVVDTGRRRRWSEEEKLKIVVDSFQGPRQVAATARRYGLSRSLLLRWRRSFHPEPKDATGTQFGFVPAKLVPDPEMTPDPISQRAAARLRSSLRLGLVCGPRARSTRQR